MSSSIIDSKNIKGINEAIIKSCATTITEIQCQIDNGNVFTYDFTDNDLDIATPLNIYVDPQGNSADAINVISCVGTVKVKLYELSREITGGTELTATNRNRLSSKDLGFIIKHGVSFTETEGDVLIKEIAGLGTVKTTGTMSETLFWVLNPVKKYLANIVAEADNAKVYVSAEFIKGE